MCTKTILLTKLYIYDPENPHVFGHWTFGHSALIITSRHYSATRRLIDERAQTARSNRMEGTRLTTSSTSSSSSAHETVGATRPRSWACIRLAPTDVLHLLQQVITLCVFGRNAHPLCSQKIDLVSIKSYLYCNQCMHAKALWRH